MTGRQHFDVGDEYIRNIARIDGSTWRAEIVRFERVDHRATCVRFTSWA